jgi:hypothetical protein
LTYDLRPFQMNQNEFIYGQDWAVKILMT